MLNWPYQSNDDRSFSILFCCVKFIHHGPSVRLQRTDWPISSPFELSNGLNALVYMLATRRSPASTFFIRICPNFNR